MFLYSLTILFHREGIDLESIFQKEDFTKAEIVEALKAFLPNFEHEEKGKNLDQKM